ncbi:valine--tRNA ligase [Kingella kingae]|uniref:valine--tRNA ligase n=1 Tax=Kingella kingae TaxID=504 RepID=UPI00254AC7E1|nr:valine--tRNA ligase [Kingella kingae]MDK4530302.1 valine--tRNA ligase [Kingella kingae]MDK4580826.1 valine--tRNA ligase [Kingella kingae]
MLNKYNPSEIETKHYQNWEQNGYFAADFAKKDSFSIQLPPPNVTGTLHMGHAFNQTIMDGLARYYRMKGFNTCWIPGTDHAGIATQIVVERQLAEQNISRHDLGREAFLEKVWQWKEKSGGTITQQMRRVGCSADWSREYFTMDDTRAEIVTQVFVKLYNQGLIYRGKRLVNWDPVLGTAVSDLEVENVEENGFMYYVRYPFVTGQGLDGQFMLIATTRPETILADGALAVAPQDERYSHLVGKKVQVPMTDRIIPIIEDEYVDKAFGTGCVKITPAHDFNDYAVGQRHEMEVINLFTPQAVMNDNAPEQYRGLDRFVARDRIIDDLKAAALLEKIEPHKMMRPRGDRTGTVIEPYLTDQWFVAMSATSNGGEPDSEFKGMSLAQKAKHAVDSGAVKFVPENWVNTYNQWMNNIQDWCISRQLWWGHQIPAWYDENGKIYVALTEEEAQKQAGSLQITRDEDVLDTWFSSALVPFSTLGWKDGEPDTEAMKAFIPSSALVTGYEIIFFWVARMIMMTTHIVGKVPFRDVYIHGIVRDHEGKKMSKSEGNVIDPVDLIDGIDLENLLVKRTTGLRRPETAPAVKEATKKLFPEGIPSMGADALRFTMASYASLGRGVNFDFKRAEGYRNFCNKIWNATNFVLMNTEEKDCGLSGDVKFSFVDEWIISRLQQTIAAVAQAYETYRFDLAAELLYSFVWNDYCDWYLELAKVQLQSGDEIQARSTRRVLLQVLEASLRLLHPIMPFITEELWQVIAPMANAKTADSIMIAAFPVADESQIVQAALDKMAALQELIGSVRNLRGEMGIQPSVKAPLFIESADDLAAYLNYLPMLARLTEATQVDTLPESEDAPVAVCNGARLMLKVEVDKAAETARLNKEAEKLQKALDKLNAKLSKAGYMDKAPAHLVEKDKAELAELEDKMAKVKAALAKLA